MKKEEIPFEMAVLVDLLKPPSIEEELSMEKDIRHIQSSNNIEEVKRYSEAITRQNHEQSRFISGCLHEIHVLKAKLACATTPEKRPNKNLLEKILRL